MVEYIDRQEAIGALRIPDYENGEAYHQYLEDKAGLEKLPSSQTEVDCQKCVFCGFTGFKQFQAEQPEQRWIPCSERLPEVGRSVLLSVNIFTAEGCLRDDGDWAQFRWTTKLRKDMVGAWMPLPSPYKEEQE